MSKRSGYFGSAQHKDPARCEAEKREGLSGDSFCYDSIGSRQSAVSSGQLAVGSLQSAPGIEKVRHRTNRVP